MMNPSRLAILGTTCMMVAACAYTPMGPTVNVMPPAGKPFEVFAQEQSECKQYADSQVQGQADRANSTGVLEGVGGTVLGAGLGAAIGGGRGAAVGAGAGALGGTAVGSSTSGAQQRGIQVQYNNAYTQCMSAKGNNVPAPVVVSRPQTTVIYQAPPPPPPTVIYTQPPVYYPAPPPPY